MTVKIEFGKNGGAAADIVLGFSAPEDGYTWTIGHRAVLCTDMPQARDGFTLDITWSPYLPPGRHGQHVGISVGGRRIATHEVRALESVSFACPPPQRHERRLLIEFDLPDAAAPSAAAGHHDDRVLALCFRWINILPAAPPPPLTIAAEGEAEVADHRRAWPALPRGGPATPRSGPGLDVIFGTTGNAGRYLREGWSTPEPGYVWTTGARSVLALPKLEAAAWELEAEIQPFTHGARLPAQRLGLSVNGVAAGMVQLHTQAVVKLALPHADGPEELVFDVPDAARPMDVAGGTDDRVLGFSFKRLLLTPAPAPLLPRPAPHLAEAPAEAADKIVLGFESIGENCEFGLVQRRCGAEPLGLLRFASAPLPPLLAALHARFDGLGSPDSISVELSENGREYMIRDAAFGFYWHAWVLAGEKTPAEIRDREARRVPFLVRKLTEDLASGEKIFVYHGMKPLTGAHAHALSRAIRLYGPSTLLWVELADAAHPPGTVEWVSEGLMKGYIDRFAPAADAHDFATDSWVTLCRAALALRAA
jgi:hypothetical protein